MSESYSRASRGRTRRTVAGVCTLRVYPKGDTRPVCRRRNQPTASAARRGALLAEPPRMTPATAISAIAGSRPGQRAPQASHLPADDTRTALTRLDAGDLFETLPLAVLTLTRDGRAEAANASARAALGSSFIEAGALPGELAQQLDQTLALLTADPRLREVRRRAVVGGRILRLTTVRRSRGRFLLLLRVEVARPAALPPLLSSALGLTNADARLALRVYRGLSNREIAEVFAVPEGTVRVRVSRLYHRLGLSRRSELVVALSRVIAQSAGPADLAPLALPAVPAMPGPKVATDPGGLLEESGFGLALVCRLGRIHWANAEARRLCGHDLAALSGSLASIGDAASRMNGDAATASTIHLQIDADGQRLHATLWRSSSTRIGLMVSREVVQPADLESLLSRRHWLSKRQARAAVLIGRGRSNAEVARELRVREGSIRSLSSTIYERVGVQDRTELAGLIADLGAAPDQRRGG